MRYLFLSIACLITISTFSQDTTTISAVQFTTTGPSDKVGQIVAVEGIVTASAESGNLGYVYIQEEGATEWAGIQLMGHPDLANLIIGDKVLIVGTVYESNGITNIGNITTVALLSIGHSIAPLVLAPSIFTSYSLAINEKYEGMLIQLANPSGDLFIVDRNADGPFNNYGEYRVGINPQDTTSGCRILAGRQTINDQSSLNVSYVNDAVWASLNGSMNVPVIVVAQGDTFCTFTGVITYAFGDFKLTPRNNADVVEDCNVSGFADIQNQVQTLEVFPNPVLDVLTIDQAGTNSDDAIVKIYDVTGSLIHSEKRTLGLENLTVDVHLLPSGLYHVFIENENGILGIGSICQVSYSSRSLKTSRHARCTRTCPKPLFDLLRMSTLLRHTDSRMPVYRK